MPRFFFIIVIYFLFFWFQVSFIFPLETMFNKYVSIVSLIYIPHAVRILSFFIVGKIAFLPLLFAEIICHFIFVNQILHDAIFRSFISCGSVLLIFIIFEIFKIKLNINNQSYFNWKVILVVGFCSSILNSIFNYNYHVNFKNQDIDTSIIYSYIIGDTCGVFFGMILMYFLIKVFYKLKLMVIKNNG